jgi:hypothetical protein
VVDVELLLQRNAIGSTPLLDVAVQVIDVALGIPVHDVVNGEVAPAITGERANAIPAIVTIKLFNFIFCLINYD